MSGKQILTQEDFDFEFVKAVKGAGAESLEKCIQCGICSASCYSGRVTAFRVRRLIRQALMGLKKDVLSSDDLWYCTTCYACLDRCPRNIEPTNIIRTLRNLAVAEGYMKENHKKLVFILLDTGHLVPIDDTNKARRKSLNLTELPPTVHAFPQALKEVQLLLKATGFEKLVKEDKK
jgi:heterodisulfide reductase subunit C